MIFPARAVVPVAALFGLILGLWVSAARAYEPGSGVYAADCEAPAAGFSVAINADGTADVAFGGETYDDLLTSYAFFGNSTPPDFHVGVLFGRDRSPLPAVGDQAGWLEIWRGEASFYALPNGDRTQRLFFCGPLQDAVEGPSFPCEKASAAVEKLICEDGPLARQDRALAAAYRRALGRIAGDATATAQLKAEQRGWIKGRNDCWKTSSLRDCVSTSYSDRHATLLARYGLIEAGETQVWACGVEALPLYVTPFMTEPETVNLVMGEETTTAIRRIAASGVRYEAPFGVQFWMKGSDAMLAWPQGRRLDCRFQGPLGE